MGQTQLSKTQADAAKVTKGALASQQALQQMKMPLEAKQLAAKLTASEKEKMAKLSDENVKLKEKVKMLERDVENLRTKGEKQSAVLLSKDKANGNLVALVRKVNEEKQKAED